MTRDTTNEPATTPLGRNIKALREGAKMTQRDLALVLGVYELAVSRWERGINTPSGANLAGLADTFGVTIGWLYTDHREAA